MAATIPSTSLVPVQPAFEARGRARATVTRRLCAIAGFCRYEVEEELYPPAEHALI
jgi:hypothetical protein